ncbi:hypothetical protein, partial [Aeromonas sanarellii]
VWISGLRILFSENQGGLPRKAAMNLFFSAVFAREPPPACFHRQSGRDDRLTGGPSGGFLPFQGSLWDTNG